MNIAAKTVASLLWTVIAAVFFYLALYALDIVSLPDERAGRYLAAAFSSLIGFSIFTKCAHWDAILE